MSSNGTTWQCKSTHRTNRQRSATLALLLAGMLACTSVFGQEGKLSNEQLTFFESKIRPVLVRECYSCHATKTGNAKGGLRLDTEQLAHLGGNSGPAVVPGDLEASLLINAISYQDFSMPPNKRLPQEVIADFRTWIEMGAPDPRKTEIAQINSTISADEIEAAKQSFWSYQRPVRGAVPVVVDSGWSANDVDRFLLAQLDEQGLSPAADADPHVVLRRLHYDLIGLPPTPEQLARFEVRWTKTSPQAAIEEVVDALLELPQFGERWGRHWLDLARYAESNGREVNTTLPHAWRYRDYVIDSFNADKPYDEFVQEQIAGDLLPAESDAEWAEHLVATGFLALGPKPLSERNRAQFAADLVDEQVDVTTRVILGTSVACARCHDHKFDPIPQSDYYAMAGIFASTATYFGAPASQFGLVGSIQNRQRSNLLRLPVDDPNPFDPSFTRDELQAMSQEIQETGQQLVEARRNQRNGKPQDTSTIIRNLARAQSRMEFLSNAIGSVNESGEPISYCMGVQDGNQPADVRVLVRGEVDQPADFAPRGFPQVLSTRIASIPSDSSGRLQLAEWLTSPDNPLTARVLVNRIWTQLMGRGIVSTTEDFGATGERPSHPALLDYLANELVDSGWSTKSMIRLIAASRAYRISSRYDVRAFELDPDNKLHWRANPRRLSAEELRDSMLAISGELELKRPRASEIARIGYMQVRDGNLINPSQLSAMASDGEMRRDAARQLLERAAANRNQSTDGNRSRPRPTAPRGNRGGMLASLQSGSERIDMVDAKYRSVYLPIVRDQLPRVLEVFDFAEPSMVIGERESSNTPNQALFMLNNEFVLRQSESLALRIVDEVKAPQKRIEHAFVLTYGRTPTSDERQAVNEFVRKLSRQANDGAGGGAGGRSPQPLALLCQSLLASAEFRFIE